MLCLPESRCDKDLDTLSGYAMCLPNLTRLQTFHFAEHRPILCVEIKVSFHSWWDSTTGKGEGCSQAMSFLGPALSVCWAFLRSSTSCFPTASLNVPCALIPFIAPRYYIRVVLPRLTQWGSQPTHPGWENFGYRNWKETC